MIRVGDMGWVYACAISGRQRAKWWGWVMCRRVVADVGMVMSTSSPGDSARDANDGWDMGSEVMRHSREPAVRAGRGGRYAGLWRRILRWRYGVARP